MPVFAYRGLAANGRSVAGVVDADSVRSARGKLRERGIFPTELAEEAAAPRRRLADYFVSFGRRIPPAELSLLTRQLSSLLGAGVQLVDALSALADQSTRPGTKRLLSQVRERVREGSSLGDALAAHPDTFSDLYVGMVRAGETAGALETVLNRIADFSESQAEFVAKVRHALTYPVIMICVGSAIMFFLMSYVVPQVATIFQQSNAALPLPTRILIALSNFLSNYWVALVALIAGAIAAISWGLSTARGRRIYDTWLLRLPYLGPTVTRVICARFARTLATMLQSGIQLLPALASVKHVVTNGLLADAIEESRTSIREGHGMSHPLSASGLFPPLLIEMIKVGERSGEVEQMLERVADTYEREVERSLSQLTSLLEPLMTLAMAGIILFMMLAILLPIFQLNQLMR
ncbi:MAG TPA: type II secretion system inner membrane protein GspF [Candidatus Binataceae bacterium]|jgi:general secretion pathway protein F|nr:type II secretion system inner membrane protein GspF [Candidatus Binataceae bacterium]